LPLLTDTVKPMTSRAIFYLNDRSRSALGAKNDHVIASGGTTL